MNDCLCDVMNPARALAPMNLEVTCSPKQNLKLSYIIKLSCVKLMMEKNMHVQIVWTVLPVLLLILSI